ncbi:hypothetical protein VE02_04666 [Pseudogymnoascus sp. 03VT05]|nr:hypothetical protein VE02_04666 [Pseudogymnoascus sp. 03VT05]
MSKVYERLQTRDEAAGTSFPYNLSLCKRHLVARSGIKTLYSNQAQHKFLNKKGLPNQLDCTPV